MENLLHAVREETQHAGLTEIFPEGTRVRDIGPEQCEALEDAATAATLNHHELSIMDGSIINGLIHAVY